MVHEDLERRQGPWAMEPQWRAGEGGLELLVFLAGSGYPPVGGHGASWGCSSAAF